MAIGKGNNELHAMHFNLDLRNLRNCATCMSQS